MWGTLWNANHNSKTDFGTCSSCLLAKLFKVVQIVVAPNQLPRISMDRFLPALDAVLPGLPDTLVAEVLLHIIHSFPVTTSGTLQTELWIYMNAPSPYPSLSTPSGRVQHVSCFSTSFSTVGEEGGQGGADQPLTQMI